jgi:hypothetical protein
LFNYLKEIEENYTSMSLLYPKISFGKLKAIINLILKRSTKIALLDI